MVAEANSSLSRVATTQSDGIEHRQQSKRRPVFQGLGLLGKQSRTATPGHECLLSYPPWVTGVAFGPPTAQADGMSRLPGDSRVHRHESRGALLG